MNAIDIRTSWIFFVVLFLLVGCSGSSEEEMPVRPPTVESGLLTARCWSYTYKLERQEFGTSFEVICNGSGTVYSTSADHGIGLIVPGNSYDSHFSDDVKPIASDIDGDRVPDLIVQRSFRRTTEYTILSFGETLQVRDLKPIDGELELKDLDNDGKYEILASDTSLLNREWGILTSTPKVILEAINGRYVFSARFMKTLPVERDDSVAIENDEDNTDRSSNADVDYAVDLIYRGRGDEAFALLGAPIGETTGEVEENMLADELLMALVGGPHWDVISQMNHWVYTQPMDGEAACPESAGRVWLKKSNKAIVTVSR
jgi:hypothetical protein